MLVSIYNCEFMLTVCFCFFSSSHSDGVNGDEHAWDDVYGIKRLICSWGRGEKKEYKFACE